MSESEWVDDVTSFWFDELGPKDWFSGDGKLDDTIRSRFSPLYEQIANHVPPIAKSEPSAALAAILVLDQFPRNMFRGTARAFATDPLALDLSRHAVAQGFDRSLTDDGRQFLYMPMMHSESSADQDRSVEYFGALGSEEALRFAKEHQEIIGRFGRFPHRNRVLERSSTEAEKVFLAEADSYGQ
ncbi:DUF924 family protein [Notoacmeibacter sp. MSK16QG-6]|uniref:DUF924 family protein n=1 Tax=Notoacmeibacter sp. MSK16QG-6 TaxID=2957982 RepID=UPI0020A11A8E|nr:DUF924 family protein [Notoacmeibacter sp. MSK16QG-6]MCP1198674.1 DUF924 domain-containing protein [Notoacmeibacter sp. MSK16QG-6]